LSNGQSNKRCCISILILFGKKITKDSCQMISSNLR